MNSEMTPVPPRNFPLCVKRRSLWDMNKDVLAAVGGSDEAVTLWSREVLTHPLEHWTWVSAHRSANKDRKVWTFIQKAGVYLSRVTAGNGGVLVYSSTNQSHGLTLSRCACVWLVMDLADLWAAAGLFHLPILGFSPSGRERRGWERCRVSAVVSPTATWG